MNAVPVPIFAHAGSGEVPMAALRAAIGTEHVVTDAEHLARYSRCTIPWDSQCAAVVFPGSAQDVSAVMQIANEHGLRVWPFSGGRNWGYGATLSPEPGAIVMLLHRMDKIIEVNVELAYAVIEPGVSYEQLNHYLKTNGHPLWVDCIDGTSQGSVIGNALDRGVGETPYGDHFGNLCGMEVVLPTGEIVPIGGEDDGGPKTLHLHKWGVGPYLEGIFTQSNFGVVTRAGLWLMPAPEDYNSYVFEVSDERHVPAVIDTFRRLALQGSVTTKLHMINDFVSLTVVTQRIEQGRHEGDYLSPAQMSELRREYGISPLTCAGGIYGTRAQVALQRRILKRALRGLGRLLFISDAKLAVLEKVINEAWKRPWLRRLTETIGGSSLQVLDSAPHVHRILQGVPSDYFIKHAYYRSRRVRPDRTVDPARDSVGLIWFAPILPFTSAELMPYLARARERFEQAGLDFWVAILLMNPRSVTCLMNILYDKEDLGQTQRATTLYRRLLDDMRDSGYQQYRASLLSWQTLRQGATRVGALDARLKRALDPNGVLAPGRYGIE